jgi:hypothetical protein
MVYVRRAVSGEAVFRVEDERRCNLVLVCVAGPLLRALRGFESSASRRADRPRHAAASQAATSTRADGSLGCLLVKSDESSLVRDHDSLDTIPELQLGEDAPDVRLDGGFAQGELAGQLGVTEAMG